MAVDGFLYDLKGFAKVHPGGGQIRAAGAYDATALYHSMHPFTDPSKSKLFEKYKVGVHIRSDSDPKYNFNSAFAQDLKKTVRNAMGSDSWYAPLGFMLRTLYIIAATLFEYMWITTGNVWYGVGVGYYHAQIGLCVQHDASHGAISKNSIVNSCFAWLIDYIGASRWIWMEQHILWHHPHTNHQQLDPDASSAEPAIVFKDYSKEIGMKGGKVKASVDSKAVTCAGLLCARMDYPLYPSPLRSIRSVQPKCIQLETQRLCSRITGEWRIYVAAKAYCHRMEVVLLLPHLLPSILRGWGKHIRMPFRCQLCCWHLFDLGIRIISQF